MIREVDANETSGVDGLALPGSLVGESQLRIPKLEPDIIFSNRLPLVFVDPGKDGKRLHRSLPGVCIR